jgi:pimeloyl-ACP methyl ester carboxylesterase
MTERVQPISKFVTVNGLRLHYLEWGKAGMPVVVCVHGYTSSAQAFNALARHLQHRFHIIAMDVRGHGESAWSPKGGYEYTDQADEVAAFVDRLELSRFALIGTSMGGIIAMAYAGDHGDRLNALVINDIGPDAEAGSNRITGLVGARPDSFATLDEALSYRRENDIGRVHLPHPSTAGILPQHAARKFLLIVSGSACGDRRNAEHCCHRTRSGSPHRKSASRSNRRP